MKRILYYATVVFAAFAVGSCGNRSQQSGGNAEESAGAALHSHDAHNHEGHNHDAEDHDHEGHSHDGHSHDAHNHEGHNHDAENHDHEGHSHEGHSHDAHSHDAEHAHTHEGHSHDAEDHDHEGHSHDGHSHDAHNHEGHSHDAEDHDHEGHSHDGHSHDAHNHEGHNHDAEDHGDEIIFPQSQAARTDFKVEELVPVTFSRIIRCSGQILSAPGDEAVIVAPISGVVSFADAKLAPGASLGRGQKVFYITSDRLASGNEFAKIEAVYNQAKAEYDRLAALVGDRIVSQADFKAAESAYLQAKAEYDAVAASQSGKGTAVTAAIGGYLTALEVKAGDYVTMGQPLAAVSQNRRLQLRADVSHKYYPQLGSIRSANFVTSSGETYSLASLHGKLLSVGKTADGSTLIPVTFEFDNPGTLIQHSFVEVYLTGAPVENALTVPLTAVTEAQGLYYAYVQLDEEGYQRREVKLGGSDGVRVQILSGLQPGDRVVVRGAVQVKMAAASGAIPHSHNHNH